MTRISTSQGGRLGILPVATLALALLFAGCGNATAGRSNGQTLIVFAAASLTEAFKDIKASFEEQHPGVTVTYNFAGSQQLVTQLVQGAEADIFAPANQTQMQAARTAGIVTGQPVIFAHNRLTIVVPKDNPAGIMELNDLANDGVKLVVATHEVPVGAYTRAMLDRVSSDPVHDADFRQQVEDNIVSEENNVKQVVSKVQLGEADAGIVYVSDVTDAATRDIQLVEIPEPFNVIAEYPIAPVQDGDTQLAQAFIDYLLSDAGQSILKEHGLEERG